MNVQQAFCMEEASAKCNLGCMIGSKARRLIKIQHTTLPYASCKIPLDNLRTMSLPEKPGFPIQFSARILLNN
jgi:hypothetical protein